MRSLNYLLKNKLVNNNKLLKYGFKKINGNYVFKSDILNNQFEMIVTFSNGIGTSKIIDLANKEEYILVDIQDSAGEFVGKIREEYEKKLSDIIQSCTNSNVFKMKQSKELIKYVSDKYGDELEFLWEKYDNNAIWRNKINNKWFGLLMTIPKSRLGFESEEEIEVLNIRYEKGKVTEVIDGIGIFPGYHMNKQSWISIMLDNSIDTDIIFDLLDNSYNLSVIGKNIKK